MHSILLMLNYVVYIVAKVYIYAQHPLRLEMRLDASYPFIYLLTFTQQKNEQVPNKTLPTYLPSRNTANHSNKGDGNTIN